MGKETAKKLNLGSGKWQPLPGWEVIDHDCLASPLKLVNQAWKLPYSNNQFEVVFTSHMIEHVSHFKVEQVICEINRVMKIGGILRILVPDLKKIATAYVKQDYDSMDLYYKESGETGGIKSFKLGLGQALMNFCISPGYDNFLLSSDFSTVLGGYAHVYCYDYKMLSGILEHYGFEYVRQCDVEDSGIEEHKYLRQRRYDEDKNLSLIVECRKKRYLPFRFDNALLHTGPYKIKNILPTKYSPVYISLKIVAHIRQIYKYFISKIPHRLKPVLKKALGISN